MILEALYDYYHRSGKMPKQGLEEKQIGFTLVITLSGDFLRIEDNRTDKAHARTFLVRKAVSRSRNTAANYLYDKAEYVFGYSSPEKTKEGTDADMEHARTRACYDCFVEKTRSIGERFPQNEELQAVLRFYGQKQETILAKVTSDPLWEEVSRNLLKKFSLFSFRIEGDDELVAEKQDILDLEADAAAEGEKKKGKIRQPVCLVTGKHGPLVDTTSATPIPGSLSGAKLVAFQSNSGYDSYGKKKCANAPISVEAEFAYSTALRTLLQPDSRNKFRLGDRTFVFWSSSTDPVGLAVETGLFNLLGRSDERADDPDANLDKVRNTFRSIIDGTLPGTLDDRFFVLGLAPNAAREAVVYWSETSLRDFAANILRHFQEMEMIDTRSHTRPYQGAREMLASVARTGKAADVTPNLPDSLLQSIFQGKPYPHALYASCIRRLRAGDLLTVGRAAIVKAYLNRLKDNNKKIETMLDKENTNPGYLCGRLFAVVDKIQEDVLKIHNIRDSYLNAASASPASVFATVLKLSSHHSARQKEGSRIFYEKFKQEIISKLPNCGFPRQLGMEDQGRFFVGYYQQRQDFFTRRETSDSGESEAEKEEGANGRTE